MTAVSGVRVAAIDLGASSGRVMVGEIGPGVLRLVQVTRFSNDPVTLPDGLHWNVLELYRRAREGLAACGDLASVGIDAWAVDYGLLRDGRLLGTPYHYRDEGRTSGVDTVRAVVPHREMYQRNGLQFLPFNTVYQLAADPWLAEAEHLLLIPDLLAYWLTGELATERTNASTTGLLDVRTGRWDDELVDRLGYPRRVFGRLVEPGDPIGTVAGLGVTLTAVGSHDTASAVVGVPIQSDDAAYISCGTWGLVGVELDKPVVTDAGRAANFTNEGGVDGRVRFLTNVMGLWMLSECLRAWGRADSLDGLLAEAAGLPATEHLLDVQDPVFLPPGNMPARIEEWYAGAGLPAPSSRPAIVRAVLDSLAQAFADAVDKAEELSGHPVRVIHLVGGGALNRLLCQATADRSGRVVLAGPVEATALGNVLVQARAAGALSGDLETLRRLVADTTRPVRYQPRG
jgi:rhamnulokinase